ncbi:MAG: hypothetical protein P8J37_00350 [Fuerstiella sp.]|nr:hypothetical protein [Fuerstiella sp.]
MFAYENGRSIRIFITLALFACSPNALADRQTALRQLEDSRTRYATPAAWAQRRMTLRREFLKAAKMSPLVARPSVPAIINERRSYKDYSVENVALETFPGFYCTGNLYRPVGRKDLSPVILCPHGHFRPLGRFRESQQMRCAHLARMGATVFSYSMVGYQDSTQTTHDDPLVLALQTWNSLRAVDFLTSLPRIDSARVGVTGASGGGTQAMFLALIDDRVGAGRHRLPMDGGSGMSVRGRTAHHESRADQCDRAGRCLFANASASDFGGRRFDNRFPDGRSSLHAADVRSVRGEGCGHKYAPARRSSRFWSEQTQGRLRLLCQASAFDAERILCT